MNKPQLPLPPQGDKPKRRNIAVKISEFEEWTALKNDGETWTALLRRVRMGWSDLKNINITIHGATRGYNPGRSLPSIPAYTPHTSGMQFNKKFKRIWFLWPLPLLPLVNMFKQDIRENIPRAKEKLKSIPEDEILYRQELQAARIMQAKKRLQLA